VTVVVNAYKLMVPANTPPPRVNIQFRFLREGEVTSTEKFLRLYRGWDSLSFLALVFWAESGEYSQTVDVDLATLQSLEWLAFGRDDAAPRKVRAAYLALSEGGTYTFNITSGEGGAGGEAATLEAVVRVDGALADREVVVIEKPSSGQWRLAGYGPTPGGDGTIDVKVTDGQCYALGMDDWGVAFQANLAVTAGQTIRPNDYTGWLYRITEAGVLPSAEPEWWAAEGDNATRPLGTARAVAVRYYRPLAHGPIPVEML
jgi:hypothetical protein